MAEDLDAVIVGGGLAGSALAAVLARRGHRIALIDPHGRSQPDFRAEKLTRRQIAILARLDLLDPVWAASTPIPTLAVARFGRLVETRPCAERGIDYPALVDALRGMVPPALVRQGRVCRIEADEAGACVALADGRRVAGRVVVIATGLARSLVEGLGIRRVPVAEHHSLAIGFDLRALGGAPLPALTYFGESPGDLVAYLTLFPIGDRARANLFTYHRHDGTWALGLKADPVGALQALMPGLAALLPPFAVATKPVLRPIHLYRSENHLRPGAVLVGDAFSTACPTGGTGVDKALTDVERLAALLPGWLGSPGMAREKVARFYADPVKRASDRGAESAIAHARGMALGSGPAWALRRRRNYHAQLVRSRLRSLLARPARTL